VLALHTAIELVSGSIVRFGRRVVILDAAGIYAPLGLADALSSRGIEVTLVTPDEGFSRTAFDELDLQHVMP